MGGTCFGLDFIKTASGYIVVDINNSPGIYYDFIEDLKIPIAELFFKMVLKDVSA
jgi:glutathione synthase/RimK-type ligase-like ATP-grasp enzyme